MFSASSEAERGEDKRDSDSPPSSFPEPPALKMTSFVAESFQGRGWALGKGEKAGEYKLYSNTGRGGPTGLTPG